MYDINQPTAGALQANPGVNVNALRPYPGFAAIQEEESVVNSMYNGLQVAWNRRLPAGFAFGFAYTFSKSMDNGSNYRDIVPDTYNTQQSVGAFGVRHAARRGDQLRLRSAVLQEPEQAVRENCWADGRSAASNQFQTGTPCGIGTNNDFAGVGEVGSFGCGSEGQFWIMNGTPTILGTVRRRRASQPEPIFRNDNSSGTPIFTAPATGTFNLQKGVRDDIYQPGFQDWNLGLYKKFAFNESAGLEFRAEAFDVNNHPNWGGVLASTRPRPPSAR